MNGDSLQRGAAPAARWNPALLALSLALAAALYGLPFLRSAPNRLVSGEPIYFFALLHGPAWVLAALPAMLLCLSFWPSRRAADWAAVAVSSLLMPGLVWLAAAQAGLIAQTQSPLARTSLGGAFWLGLLLAGLMAADALQRLHAGRALRLLVLVAVLLPLCQMLWAGWCDELSIMKEYANRSDQFVQVLARHSQIVGLAILFTLCLGLPLGWAAYRHGRVGKALFPLLNVIQTIPSIALFGLLMAPLALLAASWPALAKAGISGVGLAPGVIALILYSLLPVVRGMLAGLQQVPSGVIEAARGLGMPGWQIFWLVEAPLALPVVLGGVRTATIQAVGLAAVTALIGAGGLGAIMFEGLFANAQDLVLLGVLPIILMGALADLGFKGLIGLSRFALPGVTVSS
ncbi:ABC transporter permease [Polaromonas sp. OV174]|uniref:ABC transporter permease n=1 Tax=Polaromonas sp. OV174 TaxID=1855300 RepID=UPI002101870D|nr:ABC transporter permease [Polaromonas sp. OV174]